MSTEMMFRYAIVFFLPTIYLYMLATFVIARSYHLKVAKLMAAFLVCGGTGFTFDFIRILAPVEANPSIHLLIILPIVHLGFSFSLHMIYTLIDPIYQKRLSFLPPLLYSIPVFFLVYGISEVFFIKSAVYYLEDGWIYRAEDTSGFVLFILALFLYTVTWGLLYIGRKSTNSKHMKGFFTICFLSTPIYILGTIAWYNNLLVFDYIVPPTPSLLVILLLGTLFAFLIRKFDIIPSLVKRYSSLMETSPTPIIYVNKAFKIIEANAMANQTFGLKKNTCLTDYFELNENRNMLHQLFTRLEEQSFLKGFRYQYENKQDGLIYLVFDASSVYMGEQKYFYFMIHNVTLEVKQQQMKEYLAYHDSLTGLYNRAYFEKNIRLQLKDVNQTNYIGALLLVDLNFFKEINDTYGHQVGDSVLIYASKLLKDALPKPNILARLGGDEFIIYFQRITCKDSFLDQIELIRQHFKLHPYISNDLVIEVTPSIGVAYTKEDGITFNVLYQFADMRMYEDKKTFKQKQLKTLKPGYF